MSKELLPIVLSCAVKGPLLARHKVPFQCNSSGVVAALQKDSARDSTVMHLLHCLWFFVAHYQGRSRRSGWSGFGWTIISQDKNKVPFYRKQVINKSAKVIFWTCSACYYDALYRKTYNAVENNRSPTHARIFYATQGFLLCKSLVINRVLK